MTNINKASLKAGSAEKLGITNIRLCAPAFFYHLIQSIRLALIVNMSMYKIAVHDSEVLRLQIYLSLLCGVTNIGMCLDKFPLRLFEWEQSIITIAKVKLCDILSFTNSVLHRHFKYLMPLVVSAFVNVHITSLTMIL